MAVARSFRRRGAARALLRACERVVRRWGQRELFLHVDVGNAPAQALYEALGYAQVGEDPWWWGVTGGDRRLLLRKEL